MQKGRLKDLIAKRLFGYGPVEDQTYVDKFTGPTKDIKLLGVYSGITYACINAISEEVGKYEPYLFTISPTGEKKTIAKHPFLELLAKPNPDTSSFQFFEGVASFTEQFGEAFLYFAKGAKTGQPREVYLLRPDKIGISINKANGEVLGYNLNIGNGQTMPLELEEVIHHMTFNPRNAYRGYSTVEAAIDYIQTEEEVSRFTKNYFANNAALSGVLDVQGKIGKDQWKKFVRQWRERYEGTDNAGKVALIRDGATKFTPIGSSVNDMQLKDLKESTLEQIMMMFRIPKGIFGMESEAGLGRASVETLEYIFAKRTIEPKLQRLDDTIKRALDMFYPNNNLFVGHVNIIPSDKEYELSRINLLLDRSITRAEARSQDPLTANNIIDGDDQLYVPINMVSVSSDSTSTAGKSYKLVKSKKKITKSFNYEVTQKENFRNALEQNANKYSVKYHKAFEQVLKEQEKRVISRLNHLTGKSISGDLMDSSEEDRAFQDELMPILTDLVSTQGQLAFEFAGDTNKYNYSNSVINAVRTSTQKMSRNFDDQTLQALNDTLVEGISNNEAIGQLTTRVEDVYSSAKGYRAERVARTESQYVSNSASLDAYQQTSYVTSMEWFANPDCCPFCEELDGTVVGITETFVNAGDSVDVTDDNGDTSSYTADYGNVDTPPLHPNCTCSIIPVVE